MMKPTPARAPGKATKMSESTIEASLISQGYDAATAGTVARLNADAPPSPRAPGFRDCTPQAAPAANGAIAGRLQTAASAARAAAEKQYRELLQGGIDAFAKLSVDELAALLATTGHNPDADLAVISRVRAAETALADGEISQPHLDQLKAAERAALAGVRAAEKSLNNAQNAYTAAQQATRRVEWRIQKLDDELRDIRRQMPGYLSQIVLTPISARVGSDLSGKAFLPLIFGL